MKLALIAALAFVVLLSALSSSALAAVQLDWTQCSNDNDNNEAVDSPLCTWQNGDLNSNNALYTEGNIVPNLSPTAGAPTGTYTTNIPGHVDFRGIVGGLVNGTYVLNISYNFMKGGIFAYDFLTSPYGVNNTNACSQLPGFLTSASCTSLIGGAVSNATIPLDTAETVAAGYGGGSIADRQTAHSTAFSSFLPRAVRLYGATITSISNIASTGTATDKMDSISITFNKTSNSSFAVAILFGGHLAIGMPFPTGYGSGNGSSSISGAPFHVTMDSLGRTTSPIDSNVLSGGRDRSIQPAAISPPPQNATLAVIKNVTNNNGGTLVASNFTIRVKNSTGSDVMGSPAVGSASGTAFNLAAGTYNVSENTPPTGYAFTGITGDCFANGSITLAAGQNKTCIVNNDDIQPKLIVFKHVINNNGGNLTAGDFIINVSGNSSSPSMFAGNESGTTVTLNAGSYNVSEAMVPGYNTSFSADCSGSIAIGQTKTCNVTNDDQPAILNVTKIVINNGFGPLNVSNFTLYVNNQTVTSGVPVTLNASTYNVTENNTNPFYQTTFGGDCDANGQVTLGNGENKTCIITNEYQRFPGGLLAGAVYVIKHVINDDGGTSNASDFGIHFDAANADPPAPDFPGEESPGTLIILTPGSYNVTENQSTSPTGYQTTYSSDCAGSVSATEIKTCTITNDDIPPVLTIIKHVVNNNGGNASASSFIINISATNASFNQIAGDENGTNVTVAQGAFNITEVFAPFGYVQVSALGDCAGTINIGQVKTCTITNDDIQPYLTVIKNVVNDNGGTNASGDWAMNVTGSSPFPFMFPGSASGTKLTINAGNYSVNESGPFGYNASFSADCSGSINIGENKTCNVTNDDIQPKLIVFKHVINDNNGTDVASDWNVSVNGSNVTPTSFPGDENGTMVMLDAGNYSVNESGPFGYNASFSTDCAGSISVGDVKTCNVTNDDIQPHLIVIKHVINDNDGIDNASDWNMSVTGNNATPPMFVGDENGTLVTLDAGGYNVSESGPFGYSAMFSANCSGSIGVGENRTCTVTNDDIQPYLTVYKFVINDNGGTAIESDWTMNVTGNSPSPATFNGSPSGVLVAINQGTYSVSESGPSGYLANFSADCGGTILVGQNKTCNVTNDDIQPKLFVFKHVINDNGGTNNASDWNMTVTGNNTSPTVFPGDESGTMVMLDAGAYNVTESGPFGYAASFSANCTGTMSVGDVKTCNVTNNDIQPILNVVKIVVNDNGGTNVSANWTMNVTGNNATPSTFNGSATGTIVMLDAGNYSVNESGPAGYSASFSTDCNGTISVGQNLTCTVTNDDIPPQLQVLAEVINNDGGTLTLNQKLICVNAINPDPACFHGAPLTIVTLNQGPYFVTESPIPDYETTYQLNCKEFIFIGQTKRCLIINDDLPVEKRSKLTDTSFCNFDVDPLRPGDQFRNILTKASKTTFKDDATNPGQFYYNVPVFGPAGSPVSLFVTIPWPFVTQGSVPIQVHDAVTLTPTCRVPGGNDLTNSFTVSGSGLITTSSGKKGIALSTYPIQSNGQVATFILTGILPPTGFIEVTVHLEYGLKGQFFTKSPLNNNAFNIVPSKGNKPDLTKYTFSVSGNLFSTDSAENENVFK